jgi:hypothetical protein
VRAGFGLHANPARLELAGTVPGKELDTGAHFEIHPERELALDVFYHPYAYRREGHLAA